MRLLYGLVSKTATYWLHYVAQAQEFYADEDLEVVEVLTRSTHGGVDALISSAVDIGSNCPDLVIAAIEDGHDLAVAGGVIHRPVSAIVARPDVSLLPDLRGRRVAMTDGFGGVSSLLRSMLRRQGLAPGDYKSVVVDGGTPVQAQALREGQVDAAMLTHPFEAQLARDGFQILATTADAWERYAFTTLNVRRLWAGTHTEELAALIRATTRAGAWLRDPAHLEAAQEILAEATGLPSDQVEATYRRYVQQDDVLAWEAEVNRDGLRAVLDLMGEERILAQPAPVDRYVL